MTRAFPPGFEWGTATAAHQIEGGNWNNDWWAWEHADGTACVEPSGDACDPWHRWPEDVALVRALGLDNYRFSVEWSRIEPEDGEWSDAAVAHYRAICESLLADGITPVVTFHHFTTPRWLAERGGWSHPDTAVTFERFAARLAGELGPVLGRVCTLNEPNAVALMGYLMREFPPGRSDFEEFTRASEVLGDAHRRAVAAVRAHAPGVPVGMTLALMDFQAVAGGEEQARLAHATMDDPFLAACAGDDFVGVQTYSRLRFGPDGIVGPEDGVPVLTMGYEYYPAALGNTIRRVHEVLGGAVPIHVTENGIGTDDDAQRIAYVEAALGAVLDCIDEGIPVHGYTYWSLLDNFEWAHGFGPRFGLVEVDRTTFTRTPKPSFARYAEIVAARAL